jgi:PAS domain S-box-containing protein
MKIAADQAAAPAEVRTPSDTENFRVRSAAARRSSAGCAPFGIAALFAVPGAKDIDMETPEIAPSDPSNEARKVVEQYRQIAGAAMADAETWLRQGALSRAIPEAMPDAILVADDEGKIISVNSQFELMFGYHRSEVIGRTPEMLLPEAVRARHVEHRRGYVDNPRVREMGEDLTLLGRRKNGLEFRVQVKLGPVVIPTGVYTIVVIRRTKD